MSVMALILVAEMSSVARAQDEAMTIKITSTAFEHMQPIPLKHSAYGENVSPAIA